MTIDEWAARWSVDPAALAELRAMLTADDTIAVNNDKAGEAAVQVHLRLAASAEGGRLWRNNVGAGKLENGSYIRWGLANDSKLVNSRIKSADLIGIRPVVITPQHVGQTIGQFWSREVNRPGWKYHESDEHEAAQMRWAMLVWSLGGDAAFSSGKL